MAKKATGSSESKKPAKKPAAKKPAAKKATKADTVPFSFINVSGPPTSNVNPTNVTVTCSCSDNDPPTITIKVRSQPPMGPPGAPVDITPAGFSCGDVVPVPTPTVGNFYIVEAKMICGGVTFADQTIIQRV